MRELIKQYQRGENREIIERILELTEQDLKAIKDNGEEPPQGDIFFIAYRIRAILMKNALQGLNYENKYDKQERRKLYKEFWGYMKSLFNASRFATRDEYGKVKVGFENYAIDLNFPEYQYSFKELEYEEGDFNFYEIVELYKFDSLFKNAQELFNIFPYDYQRILELAREFQDISKDSEEFKKHFEESKRRLLPHLIAGLEYALMKVDPDRAPREIVKYINRAMLTKYIELFQESEGKIRKYDTENKKNIYIDPSFQIDPWLLILIWKDRENEKAPKGHTLNYIGADSFDLYLTKGQKEFLLQVYQAVKEELEKENKNAFRFDKEGKPIIQKRYFAKKLGIEEANFKIKLKRVVEKIKLNWAIVWSKK